VTTSKGVAGTRILFNSASDHGFMGRYQFAKKGVKNTAIA
jgi:hypothetical protein